MAVFSSLIVIIIFEYIFPFPPTLHRIGGKPHLIHGQLPNQSAGGLGFLSWIFQKLKWTVMNKRDCWPQSKGLRSTSCLCNS